MDKFEIGQTIRIKSWNELRKEFGTSGRGNKKIEGAYGDMYKGDMAAMFCDKTFVVKKLYDYTAVIQGYCISPDFCELVE